MPTPTEIDRATSPARSSWPRAGAAGQPQPAGRGGDRRRDEIARRGLPPRARRPPRRGRGDPRRRRPRPGRRDPVRVARALLPPGQDAALHRRDQRPPGSRASSSPPTIRPSTPPGAGSGSCATRASRWWSPTASSPARARLLNQPFRKHARTGRPWVLFKSAMTLDGKVATRSGDSKWISGEESRQRAHQWRAECDAVAVGIGTALADDPQLTRADRRASVRQPAPGRVRLAGAAAADVEAGRATRGRSR